MTDEEMLSHLAHIRSTDKERQNQAYYALLAETENPVDWAYAAWDELVAGLRHADNHVRAISAQLLANLAKSDPEKRMLRDFAALLAVTKDERFVTARHCLQSLWKVGISGPEQQRIVVAGLAGRFAESESEKNGTLVRFDIQQGLRQLYDVTMDETIRAQALALIETEVDLKYRRKYASVWRKA